VRLKASKIVFWSSNAIFDLYAGGRASTSGFLRNLLKL